MGLITVGEVVLFAVVCGNSGIAGGYREVFGDYSQQFFLVVRTSLKALSDLSQHFNLTQIGPVLLGTEVCGNLGVTGGPGEVDGDY